MLQGSEMSGPVPEMKQTLLSTVGSAKGRCATFKLGPTAVGVY